MTVVFKQDQSQTNTMGIMKNKWSGKSLPLRKRLEKMKKQELIKLCTELDLASFGSKAELVKQIKVCIDKSESNSSKDSKLNGENNFAVNVIENKKELGENEDDSYDLQFFKATDNKITFIDDPTEDKNTCGVRIFLPANSGEGEERSSTKIKKILWSHPDVHYR